VVWKKPEVSEEHIASVSSVEVHAIKKQDASRAMKSMVFWV
jgi:hypothetical protein